MLDLQKKLLGEFPRKYADVVTLILVETPVL